MPRGGRRSGTPGKAYGNRSDLNRAAPHQQYGKGAAQEAAMKAVPLQPPAPVPAGGGAPQGAPDLMALAGEGWSPLDGNPAQTARPNEPTTAGLDIGPGAGSEVLPALSPPEDPDLPKLIPMLPFYERLASHPDATAATRVFYRTLYAAALARQAQQ